MYLPVALLVTPFIQFMLLKIEYVTKQFSIKNHCINGSFSINTISAYIAKAYFVKGNNYSVNN